MNDNKMLPRFHIINLFLAFCAISEFSSPAFLLFSLVNHDNIDGKKQINDNRAILNSKIRLGTDWERKMSTKHPSRIPNLMHVSFMLRVVSVSLPPRVSRFGLFCLGPPSIRNSNETYTTSENVIKPAELIRFTTRASDISSDCFFPRRLRSFPVFSYSGSLPHHALVISS